MRHRIFLSLLLLFAAMGAARADSVRYLVIQYKSAEQPIVVALADEPVLTFSGDDLIITEKATGTTYTVPMGEIESAPLVDTATGIRSVVSAKGGKIVAGHVIMQGLRAGDAATVFSIGGAMVTTAKADADGYLDLDISTLKAGTYIVRTPRGSLKVRR